MPGTKLQAWSESPAPNGLVSVGLYEVGPGGARYLAGGRFPKKEVAGKRADLEDRGVPAGCTTNGADYIWVEDARGVIIYTASAVVLEASGDRLTAGKHSWPRDALARIIAFAADDFIKRGVKAALRTGEEVDVLIDISTAAYSDPTYNQDELLIDGEWIVPVAAALSRWAGTDKPELRGI